ncbi:glycine oxidase-like isoform X1 [Zingiber officinale]|uniref:glycine oxidase-like isoform X1 n=1 Tax=Zingiber officinale TaxID=94328 RepID=UPI001C4B977D|nr:glycine oxidase-like isoform X1 [Zingiber officinale]
MAMMEPIARPSPNPNPSILFLRASSSVRRISSVAASRFPFDRWRSRPRFRAAPPRSADASLPKSEHDVVVVGAGIIGLTIARQILVASDLSVAVVDAAVPCSGATGAGQGYIWMANKTLGSETWELAARSKQLWEKLSESIRDQGKDPAQVLGWKKTGSLLVGRTQEEMHMLKKRVKQLNESGLRAEYLSTSSLQLKEPALKIGKEGGAAFVPDDCQLDASQTVAFIEEGNKQFLSHGRYAEFYNDPALSLVSSASAQIVGIQTSKRNLYAKRAVVIAAGTWSGTLMQNLLVQPNILPNIPVMPRKGYLIVLENFNKLHLNHGVMEVGYMNHHRSTSGAVENYQSLPSISMTATLDVKGNLLLGSSRQFVGFNRELDESIVQQILDRAGQFFPALNALSLDIKIGKRIRIGHRPYMPDGKPVIGPVPGFPNLFLAAGHEGSGLSLALGTAEMVTNMITGDSRTIDHKPYSVEGRFC